LKDNSIYTEKSHAGWFIQGQ